MGAGIINRICVCICVCISLPLFARQTVTQTIRGTVTDKISHESLPGAAILILNTDPPIGTASDEKGNFSIENVPVGKHSIRITYLGYKEIILHDLHLNSAKELVLSVEMEELVNEMKEVVITPKMEKNKPLNDMSSVSTRAFSVDEAQRFAAAINDPSRMATSFAGVVQTYDGLNNISIRGNSPNGLLWRVEGIEVPNPNHFSFVGSAGGGISILSSQLLTNSDFSTGAFAAEYGNALSGVFDLKLRKGNNQKREHTFQSSFLGFDIASEGPFKKGSEGSYLVNYRYSTLGLLGKMGIPIGDAFLSFQDLSYNISLPTRKAGTFGLFGFGGISDQSTRAIKDSSKWKESDFYRMSTRFYSNTGATGLTHVKTFKNRSYFKTALVYSATQNGYNEQQLNFNYVPVIKYRENFLNGKITASTVYTKKINAANSIRAGVIFNHLSYKLLKEYPSDSSVVKERIHLKGSTQTVQSFFQWNRKFRNGITTNIGLHYFQLILNYSTAIEPRASIRYDVSEKHGFSLGYGLHSQLQPLGVYFVRSDYSDGDFVTPNKNLGFSKAHHFVAGYDWNINEYNHFKTEVYYQYLFNIPVTTDTASTYSIINNTEGYDTDVLTNSGLGKNYGVEMTYERYLYKNFYYLLSVSLYESNYRAPNGQWYSTFFNSNYATSLTLGKEWTLSEKKKGRIIGLNFKSVWVGGRRYTPIDLNASVFAGETRYVFEQTYAKKNPDYYRLDMRLSCKRNFKKITSTLALDIQNVTNRKNVGGQFYNNEKQSIDYWYQATLIPILSYRIEF
ncbi:MAG: TonB-dependent receptor [Bacteroidota bacterium]|nr:TonB-dependent receptor [Bacteroidota bacterium]